MPVLCDFTVIQSEEVRIGYPPNQVENRDYGAVFNTGGRRSQGGAFLMLSVSGLTRALTNPEVFINGHKIGEIQRYNLGSNRGTETPPNTGHWYTQVISFDASILDDGAGLNNHLVIPSVPIDWPDQPVLQPNQREGDFDNYMVRDVICFFHQQT